MQLSQKCETEKIFSKNVSFFGRSNVYQVEGFPAARGKQRNAPDAAYTILPRAMV